MQEDFLKATIRKEILDPLNGDAVMQVIIYASPEECLRAFFDFPPSLEDVKEIYGADGRGREYRLSIPEMLENIRESGCWGFCHQKREIHLWVSLDCGLDELIHLLAHERGHSLKPYHRTPEAEEKKAELFGQTAKFAYQTAVQIKEEVTKCAMTS